MTSLVKKVFIDAPPSKVFDLISDVESFSRYSSLIKDIRMTSPGVYHWRVEILGITLEWDSVIVECKKPERFAWRSTSGIYNTGSYTLRQVDNGTEVTFRMEYHFKGGFLNNLTAPLISQITSMVTEELLEVCRKMVEGDKKGD